MFSIEIGGGLLVSPSVFEIFRFKLYSLFLKNGKIKAKNTSQSNNYLSEGCKNSINSAKNYDVSMFNKLPGTSCIYNEIKWTEADTFKR